VLLLDNSAWARLNSDRLSTERREQVIAWMADDQVGTCLPFLLEAGYSARSADDHRAMLDGMTRMPRVWVDREVEARALQAQRELAGIGHHRLSPIDVMIAACADEVGGGVLHYDRDYDLLGQRTSLRFESVWLAPQGSL
jgi:hypothetical protein